MRAPRLLLAAAGVLLLTGCGLEKPTPRVSVVSGSSFASSEAALFCYEGQDPQAQPGSEGACHRSETAPKVVEATPGDRVGVNVSKHLAEAGWQVALLPASGGEQAQERTTPVIEDDHYFSFIADFGPEQEPLRLLVRGAEGAEDVQGVWEFTVVPD